MRISDWSSDVCSSDLRALKSGVRVADPDPRALLMPADGRISQCGPIDGGRIFQAKGQSFTTAELLGDEAAAQPFADGLRSEEHTSELQSLMRNSYAVFCMKKKKQSNNIPQNPTEYSITIIVTIQ